MIPLLLLLLLPSVTLGQSIPGVPAGCCGQMDCAPAQVELVGMSRETAKVRINGKLLRLPRAAYSSSSFGQSYYCWRLTPGCAGNVSEGCARCAVEAAGRVEVPVNPLAIVRPLPDGRMFLAEQNCVGCHK